MAKSFDELVSRTTSKAVRSNAAKRAKELIGEMLLAEIRGVRKISQSQLARSLGIRQPTLSRIERQTDMQISTLERLVKALGGELVISARFDDQLVTLGNFARKTAAPRRSTATGTAKR
jgi:transcriptional regulator with XRE-family HTH domain